MRQVDWTIDGYWIRLPFQPADRYRSRRRKEADYASLALNLLRASAEIPVSNAVNFHAPNQLDNLMQRA